MKNILMLNNIQYCSPFIMILDLCSQGNLPSFESLAQACECVHNSDCMKLICVHYFDLINTGTGIYN